MLKTWLWITAYHTFGIDKQYILWYWSPSLSHTAFKGRYFVIPNKLWVNWHVLCSSLLSKNYSVNCGCLRKVWLHCFVMHSAQNSSLFFYLTCQGYTRNELKHVCPSSSLADTTLLKSKQTLNSSRNISHFYTMPRIDKTYMILLILFNLDFSFYI